MRAPIIIFAAAVSGPLIYLAVQMLPASGFFDTYEPTLVERCSRLDIAPGTEDIAIDHHRGVAFVSTADRRAWHNGQTAGAAAGGIYLVDLNDPSAARELTTGVGDLLPHGIGLYRGADGARRLFVVNHASGGQERVEIFDVANDNSLRHAETIAFPQMHSPNDVLPVGPRQFYVSNDVPYQKGLKASLEIYLQLQRTNVVYFDGATGREVAGGLVHANGVNASLDGETVYVAEVLERRLSVYGREAASGDLTFQKRIQLNTAPDNIDVDENGVLWIGGHPEILKFQPHAADPRNIAPSHVVRYDPETGEMADAFVSLNGEINASSVGAAYDGTLLVGAVFDGHIMVCPQPEPSPVMVAASRARAGAGR